MDWSAQDSRLAMILRPPQDKFQALTISNCWKRNNLATSRGIVREKTFQANSESSWLQRFHTQVTETEIKIVTAPWVQKVRSLLEVTYDAQMSPEELYQRLPQQNSLLQRIYLLFRPGYHEDSNPEGGSCKHDRL